MMIFPIYVSSTIHETRARRIGNNNSNSKTTAALAVGEDEAAMAAEGAAALITGFRDTIRCDMAPISFYALVHLVERLLPLVICSHVRSLECFIESALAQMSAASSTMSEAEERKMRMKKYSTLLSRPGLRKQFERFAKGRLVRLALSAHFNLSPHISDQISVKRVCVGKK